ncbi:MAG: C13 family peptidase [Prevotella sp.]
MRSKYMIYALMLFAASFALSACSDSDDNGTSSTSEHVETTYNIGVIMPSAESSRWQRTAQWALDNISKSQKSLSKAVSLQLHWYDEADVTSSSVSEIIGDAVGRDSCVAMVGPMSIAKASSVASECTSRNLPLLLPQATSADFQRIFASSDYVYNLTESDITQCEMMLTEAVTFGFKRVSLMVRQDEYGNTFREWFGFQAENLGLKVHNIYVYSDAASLEANIRQLWHDNYDNIEDIFEYGADMLVFVPSSDDDMLKFDEVSMDIKETDGAFPYTLCTDRAVSTRIASTVKGEYEGMSPAPNPESGFAVAYREKYGEEPLPGEAQLYDAILMLAYSLTAQEAATEQLPLNEAIVKVVDGNATVDGSWLSDDIMYVFMMLRNGMQPSATGVSSDWLFDSRYHASVLHTTYRRWILRNGEYLTVEYVSTDGSGRTTSSTQIWDYTDKTQSRDEIDENQLDFDYPALGDKYAVIVAASTGFTNYRHQADALNVYQMLKSRGYDDDHIILIMEDDIAYNPNNINKGEVRVTPDGPNIYNKVKIDYHPSQLTAGDLTDILLGNASSVLPEVLRSGKSDDVFIYWAGHGNMGRLGLADRQVSSTQVMKALQAMNAAGRYRKMFFVVEACFSGSIAEQCVGIPGVLCMTAANAYESSNADIADADPDMGVFLSDTFTRNFVSYVTSNPSTSVRDLYYNLARTTVTSHAKVYNAEHYGNLLRNSFEDF